jgi:hypothetical protein
LSRRVEMHPMTWSLGKSSETGFCDDIEKLQQVRKEADRQDAFTCINFVSPDHCLMKQQFKTKMLL